MHHNGHLLVTVVIATHCDRLPALLLIIPVRTSIGILAISLQIETENDNIQQGRSTSKL